MTAMVLSAILIALTIFIHYQTLRMSASGAIEWNLKPRRRLWMMLSASIVSHLVHVALYAAAFLLLEFTFEVGSIEGPDGGAINDAFYFAIVSYTTLGIGDIYPAGQARLLSGVAALNGLVMVTWTASMTYLIMERYWNIENGGNGD